MSSDWEARKDEQRRANEAVAKAHPEWADWPKPMPPRIPDGAGDDCGAYNCVCAYYGQHINEMQDLIDRLFTILVETQAAIANADLVSPRTVIANLPIMVESRGGSLEGQTNAGETR